TTIHVSESVLSLLEEAQDDAFGELALFVFLIHLEDLIKRHLINVVAEVGKTSRASVRLLA
ncbi:MAG: hypothetical protein Q9183_003295, partial [Haloplaca sp. 2 TL-2023]